VSGRSLPKRAIASAKAIRGHGVEPPRSRRREDGAHHLLGDREHLLDGHERHLDIELGELELAVGALVLVAEAARDL